MHKNTGGRGTSRCAISSSQKIFPRVMPVTYKGACRIHNRASGMRLVRKLVGALLAFAVASMLPAPLLACAAMGHRCAMIVPQPAPAAQPAAHPAMSMHGHDCCPRGAQKVAASHAQCHETSMAVAEGCRMSSRCCEMRQSPAAHSASVAPAAKKLIAVRAADGAIAMSSMRMDPRPAARSAPIARSVFDLKTDLRI